MTYEQTTNARSASIPTQKYSELKTALAIVQTTAIILGVGLIAGALVIRASNNLGLDSRLGDQLSPQIKSISIPQSFRGSQ